MTSPQDLERLLSDLLHRVRAGERESFTEFGRLVQHRAVYFLLGAGIGLLGRDAVTLAARWIVEIGTAFPRAEPPLLRWLDGQFERLVDRDHFADAAALQQRLYCTLPPLPAGATAVARLRPAQRLSGDIVLAAQSGEWLVLAVGDVTSHGTAAAAFGALLLRLLERSLERGCLAQAASWLNQQLRLARPGRTAVALTLARWRPDTGSLEVLNCGTPSPAVLVSGETATLTPAGGPPVGFLPDVPFDVWRTRVTAGDALVLLTDGLVEQRSAAGEPFGCEGVVDALQGLAGHDPGGLADGLLAAVDGFSGLPLEDDQTTLVIRFG